jgi:PIN like domain
VRILFDECTPRPLLRELPGLDAVHVLDLGWQGRKNGVLLASMRAEGFTVFITVDRNLPYQQNIAASGVAVIVLEAAKNRLSDLRPLMPRVRSMLDGLVPGRVYRTGV